MISLLSLDQSKMNVQSLFPTPVGFFNLGRDFTEHEKSFLTTLEQRKNEGNHSSVNNYVLNAKELADIKKFVDDSTDFYFYEIYKPMFEARLRVTQSWVNYTNKNQHHHKHRHSNSFISGVLYIQTNEEDNITFYKSTDQSLRVHPKEYTLYNSESWWFKAKQGELILFPSGLDHMVQTKNTDETRISLAFNTFPVGIVGDTVALNELIIGNHNHDK